MMAYLEVRELSKIYDRTTVLDNIGFDIEEGSFLSLLGPSGCGKTTTLRLIAGFEKPEGGSIRLNGTIINGIPTFKRNIGMVFQSYALFPHMSVEQNVSYGLEQRNHNHREIKKKVAEALEMVRLTGYEKRKPKQLSGGQQQRVALARALVIRPSLLLLDESLSALDKKLRVEMQVELRQIQKEVGITTIFVTHDQEEALTLSDYIAVMEKGKIVQLDTPDTVYEHPKNSFVADFLGQANFFSGVVKCEGNNGYRLMMDEMQYLPFRCDEFLEDGTHCTVSVRPEKITISDREEHQAIRGKIEFITYAGNLSIFRIRALGQEIKVQQQNISAGQRKFVAGDSIFLSWEPESTLILEREKE